MKSIIKTTNISILKRCFLLLTLLLLFVTISVISYANSISQDFSDNLFRLHVIANSDSEEDQNLKLLVRDAVIEYINNSAEPLTTKEQVVIFAKEHLTEIKEIVHKTINDQGYDYSVEINIGSFPFPTKYYGDISLPAGMYDAIRIELGEASRSKLVVCNVPTIMFC